MTYMKSAYEYSNLHRDREYVYVYWQRINNILN